MASKTIEAAGGIVVRKSPGLRAGRLIAVVQRSKDDAWVLPRGKLKRDENPVAGARREVVEETGHRVEVHEYVGAITYRAGGRPKVVQFWHMEAEPEASHDLMADIVAVEWLPLKAAVRRLSYPLEKLFLRHAAARALKKRRAKPGKAKPAKLKSTKSQSGKAKSNKIKSEQIKSGKAKPGKTKPGKLKAKSAKVRSSKKKPPGTKVAARRPGKPKRQPKIAKEKSKAKTRDKKNRKNKSGGGKKKAAVADTPARSFAASEPSSATVATKDSIVTTLPDRAGSGREAADAGEHKTILQRMLGRLAG